MAAPPAGTARVQARYDVIVVGAGLAGLFAGALAARRGARTLVVARGHGGLQLGPGTIDVWGYAGEAHALVENPAAALSALTEAQHPLRVAGPSALAEGLNTLQAMTEAAGYALRGDREHNHWLPTALGAVRPTCLAPETMLAGEVRAPGELTLADVAGFRDFFAPLAAANLRAAGYAARALPLELPRLPTQREAFATDLARLFDQPAYRAEVADRWRPQLAGVTRLGVPAILGLAPEATAWRELSDRLGVAVFEVPLLPPSVPGIRLYDVLRGALERAGGRLIIGPSVTGWAGEGKTALGVHAETGGRLRTYAARQVILATGGFRHGGLEATAPGQAHEGVFDLPVVTEAEWFAPLYWQAHPYARFGLRVDEQLRVMGADGRPWANVRAVGGLPAGADRNSAGCREGVDVATAYRAAQTLEL
ncbi:MAG: anaerobic glycerol-3-phosphate dehydrogenase subunit B [Anaerolineales bacterium]|nr:anaerobic glycerol-3-phosphate dehydrogenase subunit B [Anaerolineales bacterium]